MIALNGLSSKLGSIIIWNAKNLARIHFHVFYSTIEFLDVPTISNDKLNCQITYATAANSKKIVHI